MLQPQIDIEKTVQSFWKVDLNPTKLCAFVVVVEIRSWPLPTAPNICWSWEEAKLREGNAH